MSDSYSVFELSNMEEAVYSDGWKPRLSLFWIVLGSVRSKKARVSGYRPDVKAHMFAEHGDYIQLLAREWWVGMMHTKRIARITSLTLGIIGYCMLALPATNISQAVVRDIFVSFWSSI